MLPNFYMWEPAEKMRDVKPSGIRKLAEKKGPRTISFDIGEPDFNPPEHVTEAIIKAIKENKTKYSPTCGLPQLRKLTADYYSRVFEKPVSFEEVIITPGASGALTLGVLAYTNYGDKVLYPDPGFPNYEGLIRVVGARPVPFKLDRQNNFSLNLSNFEKSVKEHKPKIVIFNYPENPLGVVEDEKTLEEAAEICEENDAAIISDEVYDRIIYEKKHVPLRRLSDNVLTVNSNSKTLCMTGYRLGIAIPPNKNVAANLSNAQQYTTACPSTESQYGMIAALEKQEETDRFIRNMVDTFKERRDLIVGELNSMKGIRCKKPDGAFYVFPNIERTGMSSQQFSDYLVERADITTVPGVVFGENGEGHLRISYATSQIKQGMNRMKIAVKPLL